MADITYIRDRELLDCYGRVIEVSNHVRLNLDQSVIRTTRGIPYQPQHFPAGNWKITQPLPRTSKYLAPWYIPTDAHQLVPEWSLTKDGKYDKPTGKMVYDDAYGIHYSELDFTFGCIRVVAKFDLVWLVDQIQRELAQMRAITPDAAWISFEALP